MVVSQSIRTKASIFFPRQQENKGGLYAQLPQQVDLFVCLDFV
jgi:hypothetical protein